VIIVVFIATFAYVSSTGKHEWGGADDQPENVINELTHGSYHPWFHSIWVPPSPEIESLLFALQAAIGSAIIGYFLGYYRAMAKIRTK
jgi:cobalt/nickel transport protein